LRAENKNNAHLLFFSCVRYLLLKPNYVALV
jgi:hypothetical protein